MRRTSFTLSISILLIILTIPNVSNVYGGTNKEALINGGFETGSLTPWWFGTGVFYDVLTVDFAKSGSYVLEVSDAKVTQLGLEIHSLNVISVSCWARTLYDEADFWLGVTYADNDIYEHLAIASNGWQQLSFKPTVRTPNITGVYIRTVDFEEPVYIDDVSLIYTEPEPVPPETNGDENGEPPIDDGNGQDTTEPTVIPGLEELIKWLQSLIAMFQSLAIALIALIILTIGIGIIVMIVLMKKYKTVRKKRR